MWENEYDSIIAIVDRELGLMIQKINEGCRLENGQYKEHMFDTVSDMLIEQLPVRVLFHLKSKMDQHLGGKND